jgi:stage V sporulation protein B
MIIYTIIDIDSYIYYSIFIGNDINADLAEWVLFLTKQKRQSFLYGATILMVSMIIVKVVGALYKIPITRILKEVGIGYFNQAYSIFNTIYALTVTGLSAAVARMVAENVAKGRYRDARKILKLATLIFFILGILGAAFILLFAKFYVHAIHMPNAYWSIVMIAPAIFFCCMMASYRGYYEGLSNMTPTAVTQVIEVLAKLITGLSFSAIVLVVAKKQFGESGKVFGVVVDNLDSATNVATPFAAAAAILGVSVSTFAGFIYIYLRYKTKGDYITKEQLVNSPRTIRTRVLAYRLFKIALPITLASVVVQLSALIDNVTIPNRLEKAYSLNRAYFETSFSKLMEDGVTMTDFLFGCFATVLPIFQLVSAFTNTLGKSSLPNITTAWTLKDKKGLKTNVESVLRVTMLVAAPASMGIAFLSGPIIQLLFSNLEGANSVAPVVLSLLGVAALFLALMTPLNSIFQGIGRMDLPVKILSIGVIIKFVLNFILVAIPSVNIVGASISTIACYATIAIISLYKLRRIVGVKLDFVSTLLKPLIAGLACGIFALLSYNVLTMGINSSIITLFSIAFGALVYVIVLALLNAISAEDILMLPKGNKIVKTLEKLRIIR